MGARKPLKNTFHLDDEIGRRLEAVPDSSKIHDGKVTSPTTDSQRVAYDLWCIQEDRLRAGEALKSIADLICELRVRQPGLEATVIDQGVHHFLTQQMEEKELRLWLRRRALGHTRFQLPR